MKLVPIVSRHGKGIDAGDYINISANYEMGKIEEGPTRNQFYKTNSPRNNTGFEIEGLPNEIEID